MSLRFECPRCEEPVSVCVDGWSKLRDDAGTYPAERIHPWLGQRVFSALAEHVKDCPEAEPGDDGRPVLRLVVSN